MKSHGLFVSCSPPNFLFPFINVFSFLCQRRQTWLWMAADTKLQFSSDPGGKKKKSSLLEKYLAVFFFFFFFSGQQKETNCCNNTFSQYILSKAHTDIPLSSTRRLFGNPWAVFPKTQTMKIMKVNLRERLNYVLLLMEIYSNQAHKKMLFLLWCEKMINKDGRRRKSGT